MNSRGLKGLLLGMVLLVLLAGCGPGGPGGPVLVGETTLIPTVAELPSLTPVVPPTDTPSPIPPTPDFLAETAIALITPTLPPSLTPSMTWTPSHTPTQTLVPTSTLPPTATFPPTIAPPPSFTPPPVVVATVPGQIPPPGSINAPPGVVDAGGNCVYPWFFSSRTPPGCPAGSAVTTQAAHLDFEGGHMFWLQNTGKLYVVYSDGNLPAWEVFNDTYVEGMPERDPNLIGPLGLWQQPRRGFGHLWRNTVTVRGRLGWALREWEQSYTATVQQAGAEAGGAFYLTGPAGQVYELAGGQAGWDRFLP